MKSDDGPERYVAENVAEAQAGEREVLGEGGGGSEDLVDEGKAAADEGADGLGLREFLLLSLWRRGGLGSER